MSNTLADLVNDTITSLHSFTAEQEQVTWLTANIDAATTSIAVNTSDSIIRGIAEIDDELIYVASADSSSLALPPFGRGFRGTTAASHSLGAMVTSDPAWPRFEVKRAINQCVQGMYPTLYQVKTSDMVLDPTSIGYAVPADCDAPISVEWRQIGDITNYWRPLYQWSYDPQRKLVNLFDQTVSGSDFRVIYRAGFGTLASDTDTLASIGLPDSAADCVLYGAAARLIRFLDPARLQLTSVENVSRAQVVQAGDAGKIANQMYAMYQQRLAEERTKLLKLHPPRMNFQR